MKCLLKIIIRLLITIALLVGIFFGFIIFYFPFSKGAVVIQPNGGMGNQLFQYAAAYSLAKKSNSKLYVVASRERNGKSISFPLEQFYIPKESIVWRNKKNWIAFEGIDYSYLLGKITNDSIKESLRLRFNQLNIKLIPFLKSFFDVVEVNEVNIANYIDKENKQILYNLDNFESEVYFADVKNDILKTFTLEDPEDKNLQELINQVTDKHAVCVHVRRGDMITLPAFFMPINFQKQAIELIKKMIKNPKFFIFSDSPEFVKKELNGNDFTYIKNSALDDFVIMSKCANIIVANSTYSWWATYLNQNKNRIIIAPYPRVNKLFLEGVGDPIKISVKRDLYLNHAYPKGWIQLKYTENNN